MNIYVGNLAYGVTDDELRETFSAFGEVERASVIMDRDTGRSKGFGFVEMPDDSQAKAA
ncbi:MAG: RNA-binding protein, partial [Gammaproteobacteria bacterium]|nr:RNA-binding protein [Gammaproteobacteria bacterium]